MSRLTETAGNAITNAARVAYRQPTLVEILFAYSLVTGLLIQRGGKAFRSHGRDWAMDRKTVDDLWPDIEQGLSAHFAAATDFSSSSRLPTKDEFFETIVPDSLAISADIRVATFPSPDALLEVMSEQFGENWWTAPPTEKAFMFTVAQSIFGALR